jgi:hypothetical protein
MEVQMAITTALATWSKRLQQGVGEWMKAGYTNLVAMVAFDNGHTHTGAPDGTLIPVGGLTNGSITAAKLAGSITAALLVTAAKVHPVATKWIHASVAANIESPVFKAPGAGVVSAAYFMSSAAIIGGAADNNTLMLTKYTGGTTLAGTICSVNSGTAGTLLALTPLSWGTITGGTLASGDWVMAKKSTNAGGTTISDALVAFTWTVSD